MIYFYTYPSAFQNIGGGEILLLKTKQYLEKRGLKIKFFDIWNDQFKKGDLLHVFGSVKEALGVMEVAKSKGVTIVQNPIIWYNWQSALWIPYSMAERLWCIFRQVGKSFYPGIPSSRKRMMEISDSVLAGSEAEAEQIRRYFLIPKERIEIVTYGVDAAYAEAQPDLFERRYGLRDFVLTVGRIEPRKNQLNLIRAVKDTGHTLVIIGNPVSHHQRYYEQCRREGEANIYFLKAMPHDSEELLSAFAASRVFALPSWFETPGLAALEAAYMGINIVITQEGATREYFGELVEYVNPGSVSDIRKKIIRAFSREKNNKVLRNHVQNRYLWDATAEQTLKVYEKVGVFQSKK